MELICTLDALYIWYYHGSVQPWLYWKPFYHGMVQPWYNHEGSAFLMCNYHYGGSVLLTCYYIQILTATSPNVMHSVFYFLEGIIVLTIAQAKAASICFITPHAYIVSRRLGTKKLPLLWYSTLVAEGIVYIGYYGYIVQWLVWV